MKYVLTAEGEKYLSRVNAQIIQMHLLRVEVGSEIVEEPELITALTNPQQLLQIESVEQDLNIAIIHCMLTNLELHTGYMLRQAGVYAYDSLDEKEVLIFVGQDAEGERIPPIEEREVQYLHNIAIRVSSTKEITFDVRVGDFVRKENLEIFKEDIKALFDDKINLVVVHENIPVNERKKQTWYLVIDGEAGSEGNNQIKASPNMGLRVVERSDEEDGIE